VNSELHNKYRAELTRLDAELAHYERLWTQVPQFAWPALLAPIAGLVWGFSAALLALFITAALVGVRAYLIAMRRNEVTWNRTSLLRDLEIGEKSRSETTGDRRRSFARAASPGV
jgi:hypothetical protein